MSSTVTSAVTHCRISFLWKLEYVPIWRSVHFTYPFVCQLALGLLQALAEVMAYVQALVLGPWMCRCVFQFGYLPISRLGGQVVTLLSQRRHRCDSHQQWCTRTALFLSLTNTFCFEFYWSRFVLHYSSWPLGVLFFGDGGCSLFYFCCCFDLS